MLHPRFQNNFNIELPFVLKGQVLARWSCIVQKAELNILGLILLLVFSDFTETPSNCVDLLQPQKMTLKFYSIDFLYCWWPYIFDIWRIGDQLALKLELWADDHMEIKWCCVNRKRDRSQRAEKCHKRQVQPLKLQYILEDQ